jgi:hypothetical protein
LTIDQVTLSADWRTDEFLAKAASRFNSASDASVDIDSRRRCHLLVKHEALARQLRN